MTLSTLRLALIQMTSTDDRARNLTRTLGFVREAAASGAGLIALPENFAWLRPEGSAAVWSEPLDGETATRFGALARDLGVWLLLGSLPETADDPRRAHNTSVLLRSDGTIAAAYRKIHLFDAAIPGAVELRESDTIEPGDETVVASTPWGRAGLSICYDLRFPELYRKMAIMGAEMFLVASAWPFPRVEPWLMLNRVRALENQLFLASSNCAGMNLGKQYVGRSMIVDPWGTVLAVAPDGVGLCDAELDLGAVDRVREQLPALAHRRPDLYRSWG